MKSIVVYYSLNGNTRSIGQAIADALDCDQYELTPKKAYPRARWRQMIVCGGAVSLKRTPALHGMPIDLSNYDTIILGMPVWAGTYAAPMATFLQMHDLKNKKVAVFACHAAPELSSKFMQRLKEVLGASRIIGQSSYQEPLKNDAKKQAQKAAKWALSLAVKA